MRYRLSTEVTGNALIRESLTVDVGDIRFEFIMAAKHRLSTVAASTSVPQGKIDSYFAPGDETSWRAGIRGASDAHQKVLHALRALESHLAFGAQGAITSFSWNKMAIETIPDRPDERADLRKIAKGTYPELEADLGEYLLRIVATATQSREHTAIAKSFWQEADREFQTERYIQAYYNLYFILEGLYAGGRSREKAVADAFTRSPDLVNATLWMLRKLAANPYHLNKLERLFRDEACEMDVPGTHRLIVRLRGRLRHYAPRNPKLQPIPFNQEHFQSPAWFLIGLTTHLIMRLDVQIAPTMVVKPWPKRPSRS